MHTSFTKSALRYMLCFYLYPRKHVVKFKSKYLICFYIKIFIIIINKFRTFSIPVHRLIFLLSTNTKSMFTEGLLQIKSTGNFLINIIFSINNPLNFFKKKLILKLSFLFLIFCYSSKLSCGLETLRG